MQEKPNEIPDRQTLAFVRGFVAVAEVSRGYPKFGLHKRHGKNLLPPPLSLSASLCEHCWQSYGRDEKREEREEREVTKTRSGKREEAGRIRARRCRKWVPHNRTAETEYRGQRDDRHLLVAKGRQDTRYRRAWYGTKRGKRNRGEGSRKTYTAEADTSSASLLAFLEGRDAYLVTHAAFCCRG